MARTTRASPHVEIKDGNVDVETIGSNIKWVAGKRVLVGIPRENDARSDTGIGNAAIGYINEFGSPLQGIPPRPHMVPGIQAVRPQIEKILQAALLAAMEGKSIGSIDRFLHSAGQVAVNSIRGMIQGGLQPPLKPATVRARRQRSRGSTYRRKATTASMTTPLYDTGNYIRHITYAVKNKGESI